MIYLVKNNYIKMGAHLIKDEIIYNDDIINLVLENINYGSVWKSIRSVSKNIYLLSIKYQRSKLIELGNSILSIIYVYPLWKWSFEYLSYDGVITINFIKLTHNRIHWSKEMISKSSNITIADIIKSYPESIDWKVLSENPSVKVSDMIKYDYLPWDYEYASSNTSIRIEDIRNNLNKNWYYDELVINSSLSIEDIFTIMDLSNDTKWWKNKNATYDDIVKYSNTDTIDYNIYEFIKYITLNENILQSYLDDIYINIKPYEINKQSITPNIIKNNPQLNWDNTEIDYSRFTIEEVVNIPVTTKLNKRRILHHPEFTIDDFFKYFNVDNFTELFFLSEAPWLTFDIVLKYKNTIPWDYLGLSANPNVTIDILENSNFSWIEWEYDQLSIYAQLNFVYILENSDKDWNIYGLSHNKSLRI